MKPTAKNHPRGEWNKQGASGGEYDHPYKGADYVKSGDRNEKWATKDK